MFTTLNKADYTYDYYHINEPAMPIEQKSSGQFNPYINNEGTTMAIAGDDYVIVAADKRLSNSYSIVSRDTSKICQLSDNIILSSSGMYADFIALQRYLKARIEIYRSNNKKEPTLDNIAQLLSVTLYQKRFFPYYCFTTLCGKNKDGKFVCFGYDAVGSYEALPNGAQGSGDKLIVPVLDNVIERKGKLSENEAKQLVLETMNGTTNRDIHTGDKVEILILRRDGRISREEFQLRED
jgi:20S proteasome subunit beta 6